MSRCLLNEGVPTPVGLTSEAALHGACASFTNHLSRSFLCPAFVSGSLRGATAAKLQDFATPKDSGNARRNRSFCLGKVPSDGPKFHSASVLQPQ